MNMTLWDIGCQMVSYNNRLMCNLRFADRFFAFLHTLFAYLLYFFGLLDHGLTEGVECLPY